MWEKKAIQSYKCETKVESSGKKTSSKNVKHWITNINNTQTIKIKNELLGIKTIWSKDHLHRQAVRLVLFMKNTCTEQLFVSNAEIYNDWELWWRIQVFPYA